MRFQPSGVGMFQVLIGRLVTVYIRHRGSLANSFQVLIGRLVTEQPRRKNSWKKGVSSPYR